MVALDLNTLEQDLLSELFNLSVGKAAAALSQIIKQEVLLSVPHVEFTTIEEISKELGKDRIVSKVEQEITGHFKGNSMLLFPEKSILEIVRLMLKDRLSEEAIATMQNEAFLEIGNIVINACLNSFSQSLQETFEVGLPNYDAGPPLEVIHLSNYDDPHTQILTARIAISLSESDMNGLLVFILGSKSLTRLHQALKNLLKTL